MSDSNTDNPNGNTDGGPDDRSFGAEAAGMVPPPHPVDQPMQPVSAPAPVEASGGRFAALRTGGRTTVAAALIALLLLIGAGAAGFAVAAGGGNGDGRDRSSQGRDGGRGDGNTDDNADDTDDNTDDDNDSDEQALTGDVLVQVAEAVDAEYPGALIRRAETDADGVYEAHIETADGDELTVELDESFTVTGTEAD